MLPHVIIIAITLNSIDTWFCVDKYSTNLVEARAAQWFVVFRNAAQ
jgi:hypothetical protein